MYPNGGIIRGIMIQLRTNIRICVLDMFYEHTVAGRQSRMHVNAITSILEDYAGFANIRGGKKTSRGGVQIT